MRKRKVLIIPTQTFSLGVKGKQKLGIEDLPLPVQWFLDRFGKEVFCILDESSFIKTTNPCKEVDKSSRCRSIKLLSEFTNYRAAATGTLMTKSPVNLIDQYQFLSKSHFERESAWDILNTYGVTVDLQIRRGTRILISQKEYKSVRKRMVTAYASRGDVGLSSVISTLERTRGLSKESCEHIMQHKEYTPFKRVADLVKRLESVTMTVAREDIFDITPDQFVYTPLSRAVTLSETAKKLGNQLVQVGFTDQYTLGAAASLDLYHRMQDICNGFNPIRDESETREKQVIRFEKLKENPKLDTLIETLDEIGEGEQVVVWCSRKNAMQSIEERLTKEGIDFASYSGSQTDEEKAEAERLAMDKEIRVFLANPASAAFGLNCLKAFNYAIWYSINDSVEQYEQAMHRILRGQSANPKFAYSIYVEGSVEERTLGTIQSGRRLLAEANNASVFRFN
jgi:hypothetical protein